MGETSRTLAGRGRWVAVGLLIAVVLAGAACGDGSSSQSAAIAGPTATDVSIAPEGTPPIVAASAQLSPLGDYAPPPDEPTDVSRSQIIAIGTVTRELDGEFIPADNPEEYAVSDPPHGVETRRYAFEVERYIKGAGAPGSRELILQTLMDLQLEPGGRLLLLLVPWREGTYQPGWSTLYESGGVVRNARGDAVEEAAGLSLDGYADRLAAIVALHARDGAPGALAAPSVLPGETMTPAHLLGLRTTTRVDISRAGATVRLPDEALSALLPTFEEPVTVETAPAERSAGNVSLTFHLAGGNSWTFEYDPSTGAAIHPLLALQTIVPEAQRALLAAAIAELV
ncbi:MAG: hypothetical protein WEB04_09465 [Dehalococcoidia bacterium]